MPVRKIVLTDVASHAWMDEFRLQPSADLQLSGSSSWSVTKRTLHGGRSGGVDVVELDNGMLSLSLLPTRGMGIWKGTCDGVEVGWKSPVRLPVHPSFVHASERGGLGFLTGFNELLCRCGLASNGPPVTDVAYDDLGNAVETPLTLHGKIANIPAHRVEVEISTEGKGSLSVTGWMDETEMFGPCLRLQSTVTTQAGTNRFTILDRITNLGGQPTELELLYHTNIGPPFLEEGSRFLAPAREIAPRDARAAEGIGDYARFRAPTPGYREQVFYFDLKTDSDGNSLALLVNKSADRGISLHFQPRQVPCFALWKNTQAEADGYVTGLEPATNFPNAKPFERRQKRVISLAGGASYDVRLAVEIHTTSDSVRDVEDGVRAIQGETRPTIHQRPQAAYSPTE